MNSRRLVRLMGTTFLWGGLTGLIVGCILSIQDPALQDWVFGDYMFGVIGWFGGGLIFSALSLLGFFAFSFVQQLGLGVLKKPQLWHTLLVILMIITFYDVIEFRHAAFAAEGESYYSYFILPIVLLAWALVVAYLKMKDTNKRAFIPTLFFMFSFTIIELIPALRDNNIKSLLDMAIPLIVANTWQVLMFHRIMNDPKLASTKETLVSKN